MKLFFLILWVAGGEPREVTFPTLKACAAYRADLGSAAPASRCLIRFTA